MSILLKMGSLPGFPLHTSKWIPHIKNNFALQKNKNKSNIRKEKYSPATTTTPTTPSRSGDPPPNSATGWTGELWSKTKFLILEN